IHPHVAGIRSAIRRPNGIDTRRLPGCRALSWLAARPSRTGFPRGKPLDLRIVRPRSARWLGEHGLPVFPLAEGDPDAKHHTAEIIAPFSCRALEAHRDEPWRRRSADYESARDRITAGSAFLRLWAA